MLPHATWGAGTSARGRRPAARRLSRRRKQSWTCSSGRGWQLTLKLSRHDLLAHHVALRRAGDMTAAAVHVTFMFEPAKLQMNWARASGSSILRSDETAPVPFPANVQISHALLP
jgi:hypothetical protein